MTAREKAVAELEVKLGYIFQNRDLLARALTHASMGEGVRRLRDNETLEFLGDRVLGLMIAEKLLAARPKASEGELSKLFHHLVSREACADVARRLGIGPALRLALGEQRQGGRENATILGDACEALIAAVYLDSGFTKVCDLFGPLWDHMIAEGPDTRRHNPKSALQEWAAAKLKLVPVYEVIGKDGPDHAPVFTVQVRVGDHVPRIGTGRSQKEAEKAAATLMLQKEGLL